jgi:hypothetical protein
LGEGADDIVATSMPEVFIPPPEDTRFRVWDRVAAFAQLKNLTFTVNAAGGVVSNMAFADIIKQRGRRAKRGLQ